MAVRILLTLNYNSSLRDPKLLTVESVDVCSGPSAFPPFLAERAVHLLGLAQLALIRVKITKRD